ncbi:Heat shock 21-like protein [Dorcoceras hygrometricum]|uniref:Heat shock 21-like protein n=1 Tax=Dorcoceras hygrometricum TaxID=472368 RepID=A0A2Z7BAN3_9LAMI|nr:Heat shock 21-like protein [Dorcoceras hygrometricum]
MAASFLHRRSTAAVVFFLLYILILLNVYLVSLLTQNQQWWNQEFAKGVAEHGQDSAGAPTTVIGSAGTGSVLFMELVMHSSQDLHAFAISTVNHATGMSDIYVLKWCDANKCLWRRRQKGVLHPLSIINKVSTSKSWS